MSGLRQIAGPFVVAPPAGTRVRTRLRVSDADAAVLREVGAYLGSLASADLAARCAEGRLDARQRARSRQVRKHELTAKSSSRWAGALTRTSEDAYQLACRNLLAERHSLLARIGRIETRLAVTAGMRAGRVRGYPTTAERHAKTIRIQAFRWLAPLRRHHPELTGHHAAALVIGRRGLGLRARRRAPGNLPAPEDAAAPARAKSTQARSGTHPKTGTQTRRPATRTDPRQPPGTKTGTPRRTTAGDQATQDRSGPPARQDPLLPGDQERCRVQS